MFPDAATPDQVVGVLLVVVSLLSGVVFFVGRDFLNRLRDCVAKVEKGAEDWTAACERIEAVSQDGEDLDRRVTVLESDVLRRLTAIETTNRELSTQVGLLLREGGEIRTKVTDLWERRHSSREAL